VPPVPMAEPVKTDEVVVDILKTDVSDPLTPDAASTEPVATIESASDEEAEVVESKDSVDADGKPVKSAKRPLRSRGPRKPRKPKE